MFYGFQASSFSFSLKTFPYNQRGPEAVGGLVEGEINKQIKKNFPYCKCNGKSIGLVLIHQDQYLLTL